MTARTLHEWLTDEATLRTFIGVLAAGQEKGDNPERSIQVALAASVTNFLTSGNEPFQGHDGRVAATNRIFRDLVVPRLPKGEGALLMTFPMGKPGMASFMSTADRAGCRLLLRQLLATVEADDEDSP